MLLAVGIVACERPARPGGSDTPTPDAAAPTDGDATVTEPGGGAVTDPGTAPVDSGSGDTTAPVTPPQPIDSGSDSYPPPTDAAPGDTAGTDTGAEVTPTEPDTSETPGDTAETTTPEPPAAATPVPPAPSDSAAGTPPATEVIHVVQPGESLYRIGLQYGYSWTVLAQYNGLTNPNRVIIGQEIKIPAAGSPTTPTPPTTEQLYTVRRGDTLARIAAAYGVSWVQIAEANGIVNPNLIYPGQVLKIPANTSGPAPQFSHVVRQGETLFLISLRYGVLWTQIAEANNITAPYVIFPGQTLVIPGGN